MPWLIGYVEALRGRRRRREVLGEAFPEPDGRLVEDRVEDEVVDLVHEDGLGVPPFADHDLPLERVVVAGPVEREGLVAGEVISVGAPVGEVAQGNDQGAVDGRAEEPEEVAACRFRRRPSLRGQRPVEVEELDGVGWGWRRGGGRRARSSSVNVGARFFTGGFVPGAYSWGAAWARGEAGARRRTRNARAIFRCTENPTLPCAGL